MTEKDRIHTAGNCAPQRAIEILAPAGSYESFRAALGAGADAVYAGGPRFGARAFADNFTQEELVRAVGEAHLFGKKFYLTVNTLLKDKEIADLFDYLAPLYEAGLDAVIVQDAGVIEYIRESFPGMDLHASTQMTVTGSYGAKFLKKQGVTRVVPARELSLGEIRQIREETGLEIECFVHGALCYCYSGQCLLSSMIGGRSGNRGQCAQPCRLPYSVDGKKKYYLSPKDICTLEIIPELVDAGIDSFKIEGRMKKPEYVAGVTSMYRKYTDLYLERGRAGFKVLPEDREMLMDLYNRGGFSEGYYKNHNGREMIALDRPNHTGVPALKVCSQKGRELRCTALTDIRPGDVIDITGGKGNYIAGSEVRAGETLSFLVQKGTRLTPGTVLKRMRNETLIRNLRETCVEKTLQREICGRLNLKMSEPVGLTVWCMSGNREGEAGKAVSYTAQSDGAVQKAQNRPLDEERVREQIMKTGNTEFCFRELDICMDEGVFMPVQQINTLRRAALEGLKKAVIADWARPEAVRKAAMDLSDREADGEWSPVFSVLAETEEQLLATRDAAVQSPGSFRRVYAELGLAEETERSKELKKAVQDIRDAGIELFAALPWIFRREEPGDDRGAELLRKVDMLEADGVLIRNYEQYQMLAEEGFDKKIDLDHNLYVFNRFGKTFWSRLGVTGFSAPEELNARELGQLGISGAELTVYGYLPVMVSAQCIARTAGRCTHSPGMTFLTDRLGGRFPVRFQCAYCYNVIYNTLPLYLGMQKKEILRLAPGMLRIQFSIETGEQAGKILDLVTEAFLSGDSPSAPDFEYTQGHFRRGVS